MSQWNHPMCLDCWDVQNPARIATRIVVAEVERCCWCGQETRSGIYVRADPRTLTNHVDHAEA